jgi:CrcB protein
MIKVLILVGVGGGLGCVGRYLLSGATDRWFEGWAGGWLPLGTFLVNMVGCLVAGIVTGVLARVGIPGKGVQALVLTGFCGGFTTFSTFSLEVTGMAGGDGPWGGLGAASYAAFSVVLGVLAAWGGNYAARHLF